MNSSKIEHSSISATKMRFTSCTASDRSYHMPAGYAHHVHRLLQQLMNPNLHDLNRDLDFRVMQLGPGYYGDSLRIVSANAEPRTWTRCPTGRGQAEPEDVMATEVSRWSG